MALDEKAPEIELRLLGSSDLKSKMKSENLKDI